MTLQLVEQVAGDWLVVSLQCMACSYLILLACGAHGWRPFCHGVLAAGVRSWCSTVQLNSFIHPAGQLLSATMVVSVQKSRLVTNALFFKLRP